MSESRFPVAPPLVLQGVGKAFDGRTVLSSVTFATEVGSITGLVGANGTGKTTLLNLIGRFLTLDEGQIEVDGENIDNRPPAEVARLGVGRSFQNMRLIRNLTVLENLLVAKPRGGPAGWRESRKTARALSLEWLGRVGLIDKRHAKAGNLSFGQQKLLSLAMAFLIGNRVALLDEPTSGLSPAWTERIEALIAHTAQQLQVSILLVEHNLQFVRRLCDRVVVLGHGDTIAQGPPAEVLAAEWRHMFLEK